MARYTYIQPRKQCTTNSNDLATKEELRDGIQEAKDYTDVELQKLNNSGNHTHSNKSVLDKITESNGDLFFNGINLSGIIFEEVEG